MTTIRETMFDTYVDAQLAARRFLCAECDGVLTIHLVPSYGNPDVKAAMIACGRDPNHVLRPKGRGAVAHYMATGEGDAITQMRAERILAKKQQEEEEKLSTELATTKESEGLEGLLAHATTKQRLQEVLPQYLDITRFTRLVTGSLRRNQMLMQSTPESFVHAIVSAATVGLEPDTPLQHCHLVPFKNGRTGQVECQLVLGYRGILHLARQSGRIGAIFADVVRHGDKFEQVGGANPQLIHVCRTDPEVETRRGKVIITGKNVTHAYAYAEVDGAKQWVVMSRMELDLVQKQSPSGSVQGSAWDTHWEEMAKKTVIRRLGKYLPLQAPVLHAIAEEERQEAVIVDGTTGEIINGDSPAPVLEPPLENCPKCLVPWRQGDHGGYFHGLGEGQGSCSPAKVLKAAAEDAGLSETLNEWLKTEYGATASKLTPEQVIDAYAKLTGEVLTGENQGL